MQPSFESSGATKSFRFAITRHGYFCLVPRLVQVGDEIAIFHPYELAVVLRRVPLPPKSRKDDAAPQKGGQQKRSTVVGSYFELLGDAYVHGMMENEARCISDEFDCRLGATQAQMDKILRESDGGRGEAWKTLGLSGCYERILETLGPRTVRVV